MPLGRCSQIWVLAFSLTSPLAVFAQGRPSLPATLPRGPGLFGRISNFLSGRTTPAQQLVTRLRGAGPEQAKRAFIGYFRDERNVAGTSMGELRTLVNKAAHITGSHGAGNGMLILYQRYWNPKLSTNQLQDLMSMTPSEQNSTQDVMVKRFTEQHFFANPKLARNPDELAKHKDTIFSLAGATQFRAQSKMLARFGKAFGKDEKWAHREYSSWKTQKAAERAARAAKDAKESAETMELINMVNNNIRWAQELQPHTSH